MTMQPTRAGREGFAVASLVLGIVSVAIFCVVYVSIPAAIIAIVLGAIGLKSTKRGAAITGMICGVVAITLGVLAAAAVAALVLGFAGISGGAQRIRAAGEIQQEVANHFGKGATIDGGLGGIQITQNPSGQYEGTGTATLPGGQKKSFDCVVDFGSSATRAGTAHHVLIRFDSH